MLGRMRQHFVRSLFDLQQAEKTLCKGGIELTAAADGLVCERCRLLYEIRDDIPIMLVDEAKPLDRAP